MAPKDAGYGSLPSWNIVVICTVGGVLFFEHLCHQMNHAAHGKKHAMELLEGLYRELAILGVVAFVLWSINVSADVDIEYNDKHLFEAIHMTLFLAALFHSFFVGMVALYSRQITRRWDIFEDDEMRRYKDLKQQHRRTAQLLGIRHSSLKRGVGFWRATWLYVRHPVLSRRLWELSEHVSYHALRSQFIKDNQLPRNFRFAAYLKKCEQDVVIDLAAIKHSVWVAFVLFVGVELYVKGILGEAESNADVKGLFLFGAALVMACALGVHFKLKDIYRTLVHSYQASTDRREGFMQFLGAEAAVTVHQRDLFWFGKPELMLLALQSMQFLLAVMVGALIWFGRGESNGLVVLAEVFLAVGALAIYAIVLPKFIPKYTKITHVGDMVNRHILSQTLKKQKTKFKRRALPPTLRQVSVMARVNAEESSEAAWLVSLRKIMSGHGFREFVLVIVSIHFFVVAYNTDPVAEDKGSDTALIAELALAGLGVFVEIMTHFVVWRGKACFHCNPFLSPEDASALAMQSAAVNAAAVYPSQSRRNLLDNGEPAEDAEMGIGKVLSPSNKNAKVGDANSSVYSPQGEPSRCSIWACFGWTGVGGGGGCCGGIPPQAAVGAWRTVDLILVMAVTACTVASAFLGGTTLEIVHALQGLVLLRMWPLFKCPLPPAAGHDDLHDIDGARVHHAPLDHHAREEVMEETLRLLRGQHAPEGTFAARALTARTTDPALDDDGGLGMDDMKPVRTQQLDSVDLMKEGTIEEEKDDDIDGADGKGDDLDPDNEIANVGVAMALREACASHPELVQSHGPLSAPILRAMLGLDPYKTARQDNNQALAVAARAVALARGLNRSDAEHTMPAGSNATHDPAAGVRMRRQSSATGGAPPSAADASSSSSSPSELSSSEEEGGASRRERSNSGVRGRLSSFLGGGNRAQQQRESLMYQQQQEMQYQMQLQQRQQQMQQFQFQQYQQRQQDAMLSGGQALVARPAGSSFGGDASGDMPPPQSRAWMFENSASGGEEGGLGPLYSDLGAGFAGQAGNSVTGVSSWHSAGNMQRARDPSLRNQSWSGSMAVPPPGFGGPYPPAFEPSAGSVSSKKASSVKGSKTRSSKPRGRSRSKRRAGSGAKSEPGVMAAAVEDIERPVLPSFASSTGSQHGPVVTPRGGGRVPYSSGHGVPYSSGHGVPFSSGHRSLMARGTPARPARQAGSFVRSQTAGEPIADAELAAAASSGAASASAGGRGNMEMQTSDATISASSASGVAETAVTPAAKDSNDRKPFDKRE